MQLKQISIKKKSLYLRDAGGYWMGQREADGGVHTVH